jgi:hypothetical protein
MDRETTERFDVIDQRFGAVDRRFDGVDRRLDEIDQRFDAMDRRFDAMDQRFDAMDRKVDEKFEESKRYFGVLAERLESVVGLIAEGHRSLEGQLHEFRAWTETAVGKLDQRVMRLESRRRRGGSRR